MIDFIFGYEDEPSDDVIRLCEISGVNSVFGSDAPHFFTTSCEVIERRRKIDNQIFKTAGLYDSLKVVMEKLDDLLMAYENAHISINRFSNETALSSVCAINSYVTFIDECYRELRHYDVNCEGLSDFIAYVKKTYESENYALLKKNMKSL